MSSCKTSRRTFTKSALMACGATLSSNPLVVALGQSANEHPLILTVMASGGWDPLYYCNPTQRNDYCRPGKGNIATANGINYAPIELNTETLIDYDTQQSIDNLGLMSNQDFFNRWGHKAVTINGVFTGSVAHPAGRVAAMAGGNAANPNPVLPALNSAYHTPDAALAYLSAGGIDISRGETSLVRFGSSSSINKMLNAKSWLGNAGLQSLIDQRVEQRLNNIVSQSTLPSYQKNAASLLDARLRARELINFQVPNGSDLHSNHGAKGAANQAQVILHAFAQGFSSGGSIELGGWDSHTDADQAQSSRFGTLNALLDYIMREAQQLGIQNRLYIYVSSEFGRTPQYHGSSEYAGKSHWAVSSVMVLSHRFNQSRVFGATDPDTHNYLMINPHTGQPDNSSSAVRMDTESVHAAMRKLMGLEGSWLDQKYPIRSPRVDIFDGLT